MKMSLRKRLFVETVQLLTKKNIYVRRVRPKPMDLCLVDNCSGSGGRSNSKAADAPPELARWRTVRTIVQIVCFLLTAVGWEMVAIMSLAQAEHEVDHRFIVEWYVCG